MKPFGVVVVAALALSPYPQVRRPPGDGWTSKWKQAAEDAIANKIDNMRSEAKRPRLKRAKPSVREVELVCTAALTGRTVGDPVFGGLSTYTTNDPSVETETLKEVVLGRFYPKKDWPRYSVIVERNANETPESPAYTVGIARRKSAIVEFFAPIFFDVPFKGMNEWKKQIAPECRDRNPSGLR